MVLKGEGQKPARNGNEAAPLAGKPLPAPNAADAPVTVIGTA